MRSLLRRVWYIFGAGVVLAGTILLFPRFPVAAGWLREHWGSMSQLILGLVAFLLSAWPGRVAKLEEKIEYKFGLPLLIGIIAITGYVVSESASASLNSQIKSLSAGVLVEATKDDIKTMIEHMDDGFSRVIDAINVLHGQTNTVPQKPHRLEELPPPVALPSVVQNVQFAQRRVPSSNPENPYAMQVVMQTNVPVEDAAFEVDFDGEVSSGDFFVAGQPVMMNVHSGVTEDHRGFILSFSYPTWSPEHPIVVTVSSKKPVQVTALKPIHP